MAAPLRNPKYKIPKKEKASKLLRARRLALKAGREASTRFGKSLKQAKASRLLGQLTKGKTNLPINPGTVTGSPLLNRTLMPVSKSLLGRAGLAIQAFQTGKSVFDPNDNIITSLRNVGRVARDQEALGNSELAKAYNKRRELKIDQSLDQIYKDAPMSDKTVKYGLDAVQAARYDTDLDTTITNNDLGRVAGVVGYRDSGGNWIGGSGLFTQKSDESLPAPSVVAEKQIQQENRQALKTDFSDLTDTELRNKINAGARNSVAKNKMRLELLKRDAKKINTPAPEIVV